MKMRIDINCDTTAFEVAPWDEVAGILFTLGNKLTQVGNLQTFNGRSLYDSNGNRVGSTLILND